MKSFARKMPLLPKEPLFENEIKNGFPGNTGGGRVSPTHGTTGSNVDSDSLSGVGVPYRRDSNPLSPVLDFDLHGNDILYRSVPESHAQILEENGYLPPTTEMSVAALDRYAAHYDGSMYKFTLNPGTSA